MKWIIKTIALIAVLATANVVYASDKTSMCQVSREAEQGMATNYGYDDVDVMVVCDEDIQMKNLAKSDPDAFKTTFTKWVLSIFDNSGNFVASSFNLSKMFDDGMKPFFMLWIMVCTGFWLLFKGVNVAKEKGSQITTVKDFFAYAALALTGILAVLLNHFIRAPTGVVSTGVQNGVSNTALLAMANSGADDRSSYDKAEAYEVVNMMDINSWNLIRNAFVEENSKSMCLQIKVAELARSDYLSFKNTSSTVGEIFNNFENNMGFRFKPEIDNGVVKQYQANWNTDFEDYRSEKYCSQSFGFEITNGAFPNNFDQFDNDEVAEKVIKKAASDAATFMSADRITQQLSKYENQAFSAIRGDGLKKILRLTDDLVNNTSTAVTKGMGEVESILASEKIDPSLYGYYMNAYVNIFTSASKGIQETTSAIDAKMNFARKHSLYAKTWNCSNNFDSHVSTRLAVKKVNEWGSGANFADASDDVGKVDWTCTTVKNGKAVFTGTDNVTKVAEYADRSLAIAAAFAMFDSRIGEGARRGAKNFQPKVDVFKNQILAVAKLGRGGFGFASIPFREMASIKSKLGVAVNNAYSVSVVPNKSYLDETMLFGSEKDLKELQDNPHYKNVLSFAKAMRLEALIDTSKGSSNINYEAAGVKEDSGGVMEIAKAFLENTFDYNESMKENLGMDVNKSYESGYNECKLTPVMCENRYSGSLTDIVVGNGQDMFSAAFKFYMMLELLQTAKLVGDLGQLADFGYKGGDNFLSKALSTGLSFFGKLTGVLISLLYAMLVGFKPIITFAMIMGFVAGWIIPMMEAVMSLLQSLNYIAGYWIASFLFMVRVAKSTQSGQVAHLYDALKAYYAIFLVGMFTTAGMAFVQWATKSMGVGHELRGLLGITSDVFLIGNLVGTIAIQAISLFFMYHIYSIPSKAGAFAENITQTGMKLADTHSQNGRLESFAQGAATRFASMSPSSTAKEAAAEKVAARNRENAKKTEDSRQAGKEANQKPRSTEGL